MKKLVLMIMIVGSLNAQEAKSSNHAIVAKQIDSEKQKTLDAIKFAEANRDAYLKLRNTLPMPADKSKNGYSKSDIETRNKEWNRLNAQYQGWCAEVSRLKKTLK